MNTSLTTPVSRPLASIAQSKEEWQVVKEQAQMLVSTQFLPRHIKTAEQAIAIMMKGRELGLPTMQSFTQVYIIDGKTALQSEAMLSLIYRDCPEAFVDFKEVTNERCHIQAQRSPRGTLLDFVWTIEDAKNAQLANKDNWKKYPKAMLRARAVSEMARTLFPDIIAGCGHTPDEIQDTIEVPAKVTMADREAIAADLEKKAKLKAIEEFDKHLEHLTMNLGVTREEICKRLNIDEINVVTSWSSEQIQNSIDELFDMTREQPKVNTIEDPQSGPVGKSYDTIRAILRQNNLKQKTIDTLDKLMQKKLLDEDQIDILNGTRSAEKDDFTTFDYLMKNREDI